MLSPEHKRHRRVKDAKAALGLPRIIYWKRESGTLKELDIVIYKNVAAGAADASRGRNS